MSGNLFVGLNQLQYVYLSENECIDQNFEGLNITEEVSQLVTSKCDLKIDLDSTCSVELCKTFEVKLKEIEEMLDKGSEAIKNRINCVTRDCDD